MPVIESETQLDDRIERLPQWAQDHIKSLRRRAFMADQTLKVYQDSKTITPIWQGWKLDKGRFYIPDHGVHFALAGSLGSGEENVVEVDREDGRLRIMSHGDTLVVYPECSNVISVKII